MKRFAAALPLTNFTRFDFREDRRDLERAEARRFRVPVDRRLPEREARFLRRARPPPGNGGNIIPPNTLFTIAHVLVPGVAGGAD